MSETVRDRDALFKSEGELINRLVELQSAIQRHKRTCEEYGFSRGVDRELWEVLGHE